MPNDSTINSTQLVRYQLELSPAADDAQLVAARALLVEQGFIVDQLTPEVAVVASAQGADPDWDPTRKGFRKIGCAIVHITTAE